MRKSKKYNGYELKIRDIKGMLLGISDELKRIEKIEESFRKAKGRRDALFINSLNLKTEEEW